jgi:hypothetical protein
MTAHLLAPIPSLADALPSMRVAPELQALIERALAKRQTERFVHAGAMLEALNQLPPSPITPLPSTPTTPHVELAGVREKPAHASSARIWAVAGLLAGIAVLLVRAC